MNAGPARIVSRRALLGTGALVGTALGAAAITGLPAAAAERTPAGRKTPATQRTPVSRITGPALVGATFDLFPFRPGTTYQQAVRLWNKTTGTTMRCWKVYYQLRQFPTSIDARLQAIIDNGIQALVSFKPTIDTKGPHAAADRASLAAAVKMFHKHGMRAEVCLWQEVGPKDMTAGQYHEYVAYYGPVIRDYFPLVFDAPGYQGPAEWAKYDPGHHLLDGYAVDFYCGDYINHGIRLEKIMGLAGRLPVGLWEIGNTASDKFVPTVDDVNEYMGYITSTLSERLATGLPVGSVAWYNGPANASNSGQNEMVGAHPCRRVKTDLADYRRLYAKINGRFPA
jgi:hypothetical protein